MTILTTSSSREPASSSRILAHFHCVLGLRRGIADADHLAVEVHAGLAAHIHRVVGRADMHHSLSSFMVWIIVTRVEFAAGDVAHETNSR